MALWMILFTNVILLMHNFSFRMLLIRASSFARHHASVYTDMSLDCCLLLSWLTGDFRSSNSPPHHQMWTFPWNSPIKNYFLLLLGECSGPTVPTNFCSCDQDCVYTKFKGKLLTCIPVFTPSLRSKCLSSSAKLFLALLLLLSDHVETKRVAGVASATLGLLWNHVARAVQLSLLAWHVNTVYYMFKQNAAGYLRRI